MITPPLLFFTSFRILVIACPCPRVILKVDMCDFHAQASMRMMMLRHRFVLPHLDRSHQIKLVVLGRRKKKS